MSTELLKGVFKTFAPIEVDNQLLKNLASYVSNITHKNQEHIAFFGGNLFGVQIVRFTQHERDTWFNDIIGIDEYTLNDQIVAQCQRVKAIKMQWEVSSDVFNLSAVWVLYCIQNAKGLDEKKKHEAMMAVLFVLQFKFFSSRYFRYFRYPADKAIAEAAYSMLSMRFGIKQAGSWLKYFNTRSEEILGDKGIHSKVIDKMHDDDAVVYMLNDTQGRIREVLKLLYDNYLVAREKGARIASTSMLVEHDGEAALRDQTNSFTNYITYIKSVLPDQNSFIKHELVELVEQIMPTMPPKYFQQTLVWMSANSTANMANKINALLEDTLIHCFDYLSEDKGIVRNTHDIAGLLSRLRGVYRSAKSSDPALLKIREDCESIVEKATQLRNESVVSSVRTGVLLYICLRAMTKRHYTS